MLPIMHGTPQILKKIFTGSLKSQFKSLLLYHNCERSELSNPGSILMMCVRMYVSITLRNVAVMSRRNVASMMRVRTPSYIMMVKHAHNLPCQR